MRHLSCSFMLLLSFCLLGCSGGADGAPKLYPVTGTLVVGGSPLADITVQLIPADPDSKAKPGLGKTDAEGNFEIRTNGDKGAPTGKFKVVLLSAASISSAGPMSVEDATKMSGQYIATGGPPKAVKPPFPPDWGSAATSPKEVEVENEPVTINIEI